MPGDGHGFEAECGRARRLWWGCRGVGPPSGSIRIGQRVGWTPAGRPRGLGLPTRRGKWSELLSPSYRERTLIVWTLWACAFFVANSLNNWMPSLYNTVYHLSLRQSLRAASTC